MAVPGRAKACRMRRSWCSLAWALNVRVCYSAAFVEAAARVGCYGRTRFVEVRIGISRSARGDALSQTTVLM